MRKLHCCECIQHTFIIIFPSSVFIFSFFAVIPPIYRVFFLPLLLQNCKRHPWVANPHLWWCLQRLQLLFMCLHMEPAPRLSLGHSWATHRVSCPLLLLLVLILPKPSVPTGRAQRAEMVSADTTDLSALWGGLGGVCGSSRAGSEHTQQSPAGRRDAAGPALPSGSTAHCVCIISILPAQHCPANPAGSYRTEFTLSNLFIDRIPGPAGICFSRTWPRTGSKSIVLCGLVFSVGDPGHLHFTFSFILCAYRLYWFPSEIIELQLWLCFSDSTNSGYLSAFSARFLQTCFFPPVCIIWKISMFQLLAQLAGKTESILVLKDELAFTDRYLSSHSSHLNVPK